MLLCGIVGCGPSELETSYGARRQPLEMPSVNGIDVLAEMFRAAGDDVQFRGVLIRSDMRSIDAVVWFPNDFAAPKAEVCQWFDRWLAERPNRLLVYVGRDFDAAPQYWRQTLPLVEGEQREAYQARAQAASMLKDYRPQLDRDKQTCEWFTIEPVPEGKFDPHKLAGAWRRGIDPAKTELEMRTVIKPGLASRPLLTVDKQVMATRLHDRRLGTGRVLVVANGSFLLNLPLVNHEHRKLAAQLIAEVGSKRRVVFLESGPGGPPLDPPASASSLWEAFGAWPINVILLHLAALGIIFCFARWPIFGTPRDLPAEKTGDFGQHVRAVGQLLARTRDRQYAAERLSEFEAAALHKQNPSRRGKPAAIPPIPPPTP